ncbi:MAG: sorbosone dehydrogenase family protein [Phycisphaerae bacterium]
MILLSLAVVLSPALVGCPPPVALDPDADAVGLQLVASGFTSPIALADPSDGSRRLFVADQIGVIHVVAPDGSIAATPLLDLRDRLVDVSPAYDERGLLGLALHPNFADNGRLYVYYSAPRPATLPSSYDSQTVLAEFRIVADDPNRADPASERVLARLAQPQANHNGGQLAFASDSLLYLGAGDGGGANDTGSGHAAGGNAQDRTTPLGKLLRFDVDADPSDPLGDPLLIDAARTQVYALGFRNPWRFSFDRDDDGRERLFVADVGQNSFEEVNLVVAGGNYGWPVREGDRCFNDGLIAPGDQCASADAVGEPFRNPIIVYPHSDAAGPVGTGVIGGYVYRGAAIAALRGAYVFGDFSSGFAAPDGRLFIAREQTDGSWQRETLRVSTSADGRLGRYLLSFGRDAAGELYVLTTSNVGPRGQTGAVFRVVAAE